MSTLKVDNEQGRIYRFNSKTNTFVLLEEKEIN